MRKILTVATGILLLAASCSKEADNETKLPAPDENQIRATIEPVFSDATTRSEFDSNMKIIWSLGDQIGVMTPEKPDANMTLCHPGTGALFRRDIHAGRRHQTGKRHFLRLLSAYRERLLHDGRSGTIFGTSGRTDL